ncbi:hypothetical protein BZA77DRAFT_311274 [Pyronema omphalodes]|nr:hypothetical protein BZA77DRAFT_311274 [Pyronema omphalodes]
MPLFSGFLFILFLFFSFFFSFDWMYGAKGVSFLFFSAFSFFFYSAFGVRDTSIDRIGNRNFPFLGVVFFVKAYGALFLDG